MLMPKLQLYPLHQVCEDCELCGAGLCSGGDHHHLAIMVTMCHPRSPSWTPQTSSSTTGSSATSAWRASRCSCGDTSRTISSLTIYPQVISIFYYSSVTHVYQTIHSQFCSLLYLEGSVFMHIIMYDDSTVSTQSRGGI